MYRISESGDINARKTYLIPRSMIDRIIQSYKPVKVMSLISVTKSGLPADVADIINDVKRFDIKMQSVPTDETDFITFQGQKFNRMVLKANGIEENATFMKTIYAKNLLLVGSDDAVQGALNGAYKNRVTMQFVKGDLENELTQAFARAIDQPELDDDVASGMSITSDNVEHLNTESDATVWNEQRQTDPDQELLMGLDSIMSAIAEQGIEVANPPSISQPLPPSPQPIQEVSEPVQTASQEKVQRSQIEPAIKAVPQKEPVMSEQRQPYEPPKLRVSDTNASNTSRISINDGVVDRADVEENLQPLYDAIISGVNLRTARIKIEYPTCSPLREYFLYNIRECGFIQVGIDKVGIRGTVMATLQFAPTLVFTNYASQVGNKHLWGPPDLFPFLIAAQRGLKDFQRSVCAFLEKAVCLKGKIGSIIARGDSDSGVVISLVDEAMNREVISLQSGYLESTILRTALMYYVRELVA